MKDADKKIVEITNRLADDMEVSREEFIAIHQAQHCQQLHDLEDYTKELEQALMVLVSVLGRKGIVTQEDLLTTVPGTPTTPNKEEIFN